MEAKFMPFEELQIFQSINNKNGIQFAANVTKSNGLFAVIGSARTRR